jgi:hypothetical protein
MTIPTVITTETAAQRKRSATIARSPQRGRATPRRRSFGPGIALSTVAID